MAALTTPSSPMNTQRQDIRRYVVEAFLFGQDDGLADDSSFLEQGILDSTGVLELVAHIESTYGIRVNDDELLPDNLDSINAISDFIDRKRLAEVSAQA
jgi:acyl carrier protein